MSSLQISEYSDRVVVGLHRPEARNAIDRHMAGELHTVCDGLEVSPRVLILHGESSSGRAVFASGADIGELRARGRDDALAGVNSGLFDRISRLPMPVIAAIDGYALGGGAELALAADMRIGSTRIKIGNPETGLGIMAAAGATWRLRDIVGEAMAKQILFTGRVLDAAESLSCGFVTELHEPDDLMAAAHALADSICAQDPLAIRITKLVMRMPRSAHPDVDNLAQAILFESEAKNERMTEFLSRGRAASR
jgi:enoyl-CoA hydratase